MYLPGPAFVCCLLVRQTVKLCLSALLVYYSHCTVCGMIFRLIACLPNTHAVNKASGRQAVGICWQGAWGHWSKAAPSWGPAQGALGLFLTPVCDFTCPSVSTHAMSAYTVPQNEWHTHDATSQHEMSKARRLVTNHGGRLAQGGQRHRMRYTWIH